MLADKTGTTFFSIGLFIASLTILFQTNQIHAESLKEDPVNIEINQLIDVVELSQCIFHRNGNEYSSIDAADHLRLKLRKGKRYATTTENFIDRLASESSWSGKPYFIECETKAITQADETLLEEKSSAKVKINGWLHHKLEYLRTQSNR